MKNDYATVLEEVTNVMLAMQEFNNARIKDLEDKVDELIIEIQNLKCRGDNI